jgi:hypothetical protein
MGDDTVLVLLSTATAHKVNKIAASVVRKVARANWSAVARDLYVRCSVGYATFNLPVESAFDALLRAIEGQLIARRNHGNRAVAGPLFSRKNPEVAARDKLDSATRTQLAELRRQAKAAWPIS